MRDIILTLIVFGSLPFILRNAYIGVLVWSWLSYMNPHRFTWGFAYNFPFAQIVALVLLVAVLFSKEKKIDTDNRTYGFLDVVPVLDGDYEPVCVLPGCCG